MRRQHDPQGLPNLDILAAIDSGEESFHEPPDPADVGTSAKIDWKAAGVVPRGVTVHRPEAKA